MPTGSLDRRDFLHGVAASVAALLGPPTASIARRRVPPRSAAGTVQTVLGPIPAERLGFTLAHEHVSASSAGFWQVWPEYFGGRETFITKAAAKLEEAKREGVDTIVDVTTVDTGRDIRLIEEVARRSGIQIVAATGHWLEPTRSMAARSIDELATYFRREIEEGIEGTGIRAGVIKVATDRDGLNPFIDKALRAAARASKATGIPIVTHTFAGARVGEQQAAVFEAEGLDPSRVCIGHSDGSEDLEYLTRLARRGYTVGMDHLPFGIRGPLTWQKRADAVRRLIDVGFAGRLFLSNDWYFGLSLGPTGSMEALEAMNPDGMLFATRKVIPYLKEQGVPAEVIRGITVDNPGRFFARP